MVQKRKKPLSVVHLDKERLEDVDELLHRLTPIPNKQAKELLTEQGRTAENLAASAHFNSILIWALIAVLILAILFS